MRVSKHRPSAMPPPRPVRAALRPAPLKTDPAYWRARVFRSTFTRDGRCFQVRGWSVKIQHAGRRRSIPLGVVPRADAARRAQALYRAILTKGWPAALADPRVGTARGNPSGRGLDWKRRLIRRIHTDGLHAGTLSIRIEHQGTHACFPLGTDDPDAAAREARRLSHTVRTRGWAFARAHFPREITVAVFWTINPIACTYTTLVTDLRSAGPARAAADGSRIPVYVVEREAGVARTLAAAIGRHPRFRCETILATGAEALRGDLTPHPAVVLVGRELPDMPGSACAAQLRARRPDVAVFLSGVYADSDQLFVSLTGASAGYILRRRPPEALLDPLARMPGAPSPTARPALNAVRRYFQRFFQSPPDADDGPGLGRLTAREQEILEELSQGHVDKEIAQRLGISTWTVRGHLKRVFEKLGVHTRTEAVVRYLEK